MPPTPRAPFARPAGSSPPSSRRCTIADPPPAPQHAPFISPHSPRPTQALAELRRLRKASPDGVVQLDAARFDRLASGLARPYSLVIFLTANHMLNKPGLGLKGMRKEFGRMAKALRAAGADDAALDAVFPAVLEFSQARPAFQRMGATSLPWVVALRPSVPVADDGGKIGLDADDSMTHETYGHKHWAADDFVRFVRDRCPGAAGAPGVPPPPSAAPAIVAAVLATLLLVGVPAGWKFYNSPLAAHPALWTVGALVIYWFSVSGGMHNIIRGMPMVAPNRDGTVRLFLDQSGQLGAEGFIMGTLYTTVGLAFAFVAYAVPRLAAEQTRRIAGFVALAVAWFAYTRVVSIHQWKTGFSWHTYLF